MADEEHRPVSRRPRIPNGKPHTRFEFRVPEEVLEAAKERAAEREETLASAIVAFLRKYGR